MWNPWAPVEVAHPDDKNDPAGGDSKKESLSAGPSSSNGELKAKPTTSVAEEGHTKAD